MRGRKREARQPWEPQPHPRLEFLRHLLQRRWELGIDQPAVVAKERELAEVVWRAIEETRAAVARAWYEGETVTRFFAALRAYGVVPLLELTPRGKVRRLGYRHVGTNYAFPAAEVGVSLRSVVTRLDAERDGPSWASASCSAEGWDVRSVAEHLQVLWPLAHRSVLPETAGSPLVQ